VPGLSRKNRPQWRCNRQASYRSSDQTYLEAHNTKNLGPQTQPRKHDPTEGGSNVGNKRQGRKCGNLPPSLLQNSTSAGTRLREKKTVGEGGKRGPGGEASAQSGRRGMKSHGKLEGRRNEIEGRKGRGGVRGGKSSKIILTQGRNGRPQGDSNTAGSRKNLTQ